MRYLFLRVSDRAEIPLGVVNEPGDVPELLRFVADYYDDNPDACAQLLAGSSAKRVPWGVADPFVAY